MIESRCTGVFTQAYTNDFKIQVLFVPKERCYILNTPSTTGHTTKRYKLWPLSRTLRVFLIIYHKQASQTTDFMVVTTGKYRTASYEQKPVIRGALE